MSDLDEIFEQVFVDENRNINAGIDFHRRQIKEAMKLYGEVVLKNNFVLAPVIQRSEQLICPHCDSENIVYYGLSRECVCNECGEEGQINCV